MALTTGASGVATTSTMPSTTLTTALAAFTLGAEVRASRRALHSFIASARAPLSAVSSAM